VRNVEEQVRRAIDNANRMFGEGIRKGEATAVGALYTEDALLMPPNFEMIRGRSSTQDFWGGAIKMGVKDAVLTTVELTDLGNMVHEVGNYALKIQPEGQAAFEDKGKYLVLWKKMPDGSLKLHRDIWNSSLPAKR
jgi:ketosteroid isomerase-like protein